MKTAIIPLIIIMAVLMLLLNGCDSSGSTSAQYVPSTAGIELQGTWTGTDTNTGQTPVAFTITITSTSMVWNYGGTPMRSDILEYDNSANTVVFRWSSHPAYIGKYQKFVWLSEPAATVTAQAYSVEDTQAAAENSTDAEYVPVTMTKQ